MARRVLGLARVSGQTPLAILNRPADEIAAEMVIVERARALALEEAQDRLADHERASEATWMAEILLALLADR